MKLFIFRGAAAGEQTCRRCGRLAVCGGASLIKPPVKGGISLDRVEV